MMPLFQVALERKPMAIPWWVLRMTGARLGRALKSGQ
jgi:hypothetical protein